MMKNFVMRVTDAKTGAIETLTLDLDTPLPEQLHTVAPPQATNKCALMKLYVGADKDYDPRTVFDIMGAIGGNVEMDVVPDTPATADLNADLILNHNE